MKTLGWLLVALTLGSVGTIFPAHADFAAGERAYEAGDYETALNEWLPLAEAGDRDAQVQTGILFYYGHGVQKDLNKATDWFLKAARQGQLKALNMVGNVFYDGQSLQRDLRKAECWYLLAAERGYGGAQFNLWKLYLEIDKAEDAQYWKKRSFREGFPLTVFLTGKAMYVNVLRSDKTEALRLINVAANKGFAEATQYLETIRETASPSLRQQMAEGARLAISWKDELGETPSGPVSIPNRCLP